MCCFGPGPGHIHLPARPWTLILLPRTATMLLCAFAQHSVCLVSGLLFRLHAVAPVRRLLSMVLPYGTPSLAMCVGRASAPASRSRLSYLHTPPGCIPSPAAHRLSLSSPISVTVLGVCLCCCGTGVPSCDMSDNSGIFWRASNVSVAGHGGLAPLCPACTLIVSDCRLLPWNARSSKLPTMRTASLARISYVTSSSSLLKQLWCGMIRAVHSTPSHTLNGRPAGVLSAVRSMPRAAMKSTTHSRSNSGPGRRSKSHA